MLRTPPRLFGAAAIRPTPADRLPVTIEHGEIAAAPEAVAPIPVHNPARNLDSLAPVQLNPEVMAKANLFPQSAGDPISTLFDMLRTRVLQGLASQKWHRIAVTSPSHGCGKSFVATNLALALARRPDSRTVLVDLDLRRPRLAQTLGLTEAPDLIEFLSGEQPLESVFLREGRTLALGLNARAEANAAEVLHSRAAGRALAQISEHLEPEVCLFDLPPVLVSDDVLALSGQVDAVLLVTDGRKTSPEDIRAVERLLQDRIPLLGVVLNHAQDPDAGRRAYGQD